jgi:hypothetical protein
VARDVLRLSRQQWWRLAIAGLAVFVPIGLIDTLHLNAAEIDAFNGVGALATIAVVFAAAASTLLGAVVYSGIVTAIATEGPDGEREGVAALARRLPIGRLMVADIVLTLLVGGGLLLLVIPGLLFVVWFALCGPLLEGEGLGVLESMRVSRQLVRRDFWGVARIVVPMAILTNAVAEGVYALITGVLGEAFAPSWLAATIGELAAEQLFALTLVVLYLELRSRDSADVGAPPMRSAQRRRRSAARS